MYIETEYNIYEYLLFIYICGVKSCWKLSKMILILFLVYVKIWLLKDIYNSFKIYLMWCKDLKWVLYCVVTWVHIKSHIMSNHVETKLVEYSLDIL